MHIVKKEQKMIKIEKIEPFFGKILRTEAKGGGINNIMIVVPTIIKSSGTFSANIAVLDENAMPVFNGTEPFTLSIENTRHEIPAFQPGEPAVCKITGLQCNTEGFLRLQAEYEGTIFYSNPALVTSKSRPKILWGDPHLHTTVGDCHAERCRTRNLAYTAARYVYGLNFLAITDHISWDPRGTPGKWYDNLATRALFDEPGEFSALYSYEASLRGGHGGDNNVYMRNRHDMYIDPWPDEIHIGELCDKIAAAYDDHFFVVPHHTTRTGKHGEIPNKIYPGKDRMPVVEIHSKWGCSEYRGNPNPLHKIHEGPAYVQDLLAQGLQLGFVGGTDSHTSLSFCSKLESDIHDRLPGLTAVFAENNNQEEIFDSIQNQQCYATCGERIYLEVDITGSPDSRTISLQTAAQSNITSVEIVCNGKTIHAITPNHWNTEHTWDDPRPLNEIALEHPQTEERFTYYYVRVTTETQSNAWSSPVWFS
jgi:hypothetical protein